MSERGEHIIMNDLQLCVCVVIRNACYTESMFNVCTSMLLCQVVSNVDK